MILQKITFEEENRNGKSVDDFYYRGLEEKLQGKKGTGVRALAADFIRQGKILDRFLILDETGCKLEIYTFFKDNESFDEFVKHPINQHAKVFWENRKWRRTVEKITITDFLNVRNRLEHIKSIS
jgi:hypothetical protein